MKKAIELIETREGCAIAETAPRDTSSCFVAAKFGELLFNMTGYAGSSSKSWVEVGRSCSLPHWRGSLLRLTARRLPGSIVAGPKSTRRPYGVTVRSLSGAIATPAR